MKKMALLALLAAITSGCAQAPVGGADYNSNQVRRMGTVEEGVVTHVRSVKIHNSSQQNGLGRYAGSAVGAVAGAAIGSTVGNSKYRTAASAVGGLIGVYAGNVIQGYTSSQEGVELDVHMDNGKRIIATQGADASFERGDRVRITQMGGIYRATH